MEMVVRALYKLSVNPTRDVNLRPIVDIYDIVIEIRVPVNRLELLEELE